MSNTEVIKVLELSENNYYVHPEAIFSSFACVGNPLLATRFTKNMTKIPTDVIKVFKDAKFVHIKVTWEHEKSSNTSITLTFEQLLDIVTRAKCCLVCSSIADMQEIIENTMEILEEVNEKGEKNVKGK